MKMPLGRNMRAQIPAAARDAARGAGEKVLATGRERYTGGFLVATTGHITLTADDGTVVVRRSWVEVNSATWEPVTGTLTVTWTDDSRPAQWTFDGGGARFAEILHDRVAHSVVVAVSLEREGHVIGRAAIRRHPLTGELFPQLVWGRGGRGRDPEKEAYGRAVLANLCEQVGIDPPENLQAELATDLAQGHLSDELSDER